MLQHLLYVVAPSRLEDIKKALSRLRSEPVTGPSMTVNYRITHRLLENMVLHVGLLTDIDGITPYLRQHPVDLLIFDERGHDGMEAVEAVRHIHEDVLSLAQLWGPDFNFPMSRIVIVLNKTPDVDSRVFALGRLNVRDVLIEPRNTALMMRWLKDVLYHGIVRENQVGIALSGGAIEGFLYQIGVMHALQVALTERSIYEVDVISGVSSGSIVGSIIAAKVPVGEVVRMLHEAPSQLPTLKFATIFDLAGMTILRRIAKVSLNIHRLKPKQWLTSTIRSIPTGFFKGDKLENYFHTIMAKHGEGDDFSQIKPRFYVGVTDQDTFEHVTFGKAPFDKVPISAAVRASSALPPLFTPKALDGRYYIDGQVTKSCDLDSVVFDGARLVFVVDPLKPFRSHTVGSSDTQGGFYGIVQMLKALVSTRFEASLKAVSERYPDVDFLIFQPDEECARLLAGSPLRTRMRTEVIESAFKGTLRQLRERHHVYHAKLSRYGFRLKSIEELRSLESSYNDMLVANAELAEDEA
ncbi:MAG: patatin-like phospholipase family protein [Oligoflexus sp.]